MEYCTFYLFSKVVLFDIDLSMQADLSTLVYPPREFTATEAVATKNALGESPVWSEKDKCLHWVS